MKFRTTITFTREIPNEELQELYGSTDPVKCAKVDEDNFKGNINALFEVMGDTEDLHILVDPVK